jgi:uncharacterized protein YndB with AHSA1/START domain
MPNAQNERGNEAAPIVKVIHIDAPSALVFELFVARFGDWWPLARFSRVRGQAPQSLVFEAHVGGRIYEVCTDGSTLDWGRVTAIEPGQRIVMDWHLGRPVSTVVEVNFEALAPDRTRLRLAHRGWERLEAAGATVERQAYADGWTLILEQSFQPFVVKQATAS